MKLTKTLAITLLTGTMVIGTIGCSSTQPTTINFNSDEPKIEQVNPKIQTNKKPVVQDDKGKQPTTKTNKPAENKTTKTETTKKTQTTKDKVRQTPNNSNVMPDNTPRPSENLPQEQGWSTDGNYYNGERVTEEEKDYMKQYGHLPRYDDGEWKYNPYTGETNNNTTVEHNNTTTEGGAQ